MKMDVHVRTNLSIHYKYNRNTSKKIKKEDGSKQIEKKSSPTN